MNRRAFIIGMGVAIGGGIAAAHNYLKIPLGEIFKKSSEDKIVDILQEEFSYLNIEEKVLREFATAWVSKGRRTSTRSLKSRRNLFAGFLQSTNFFSRNGGKIAFESLPDPYSEGCANKLAGQHTLSPPLFTEKG